MQLKSTLRRIVPAVAVAAIVLMSSCASSSKKYGCPNKLHAAVSIISAVVR